MPDLISRAITLPPFRQFAVPFAKSSRLPTRRSHGTATAGDRTLAADSLNHSQATANDDRLSWRRRKHGFQSLPLSPLMRDRDAPQTARRAQTSTDDALEEFQKEVAMNPYAQALATPVRYCSLTLAHLPSYFLLPFTTVIEQAPAADASQPPRIKAHIQPGRSSDYTQETLAQTSYIINRQDAVRHLSRKRHWTFLVLERQKTKVASIARRSPGSQKLVQDIWVWDNQVDAVAALLEKRVITEAARASRMVTGARHDASLEDLGLRLKLVALHSGDTVTAFSGEADTTTHDLTTLLSSEALASITNHVAQDMTEGVWGVKGPHAWRVRLAVEKLQSYKSSNEIQKQLPMVQNPAGTREARQQRLSKLGARSEAGKEESR